MAKRNEPKHPNPNPNPNASDEDGDDERIIELPPLRISRIRVHLRGLTPLLLNPFTAKATEMLLSKQQGKAAVAGNKNADEEMAKRLIFTSKGTLGFPAMAFKKALISATSLIRGLKSTHVKQGVFMVCEHHDEMGGPLVELDNSDPEKNEAHVRNATGVADVRVRPMLRHWSCWVTMDIFDHALSVDAVVNLFRIAGNSVGIGDWRVEKNGDYGRFEVVEVHTGLA